MSARLHSRPFLGGLKIGLVVLIVVGLFLVEILVTPPPPAVQAVFVQPIVSIQATPPPSAITGGGGTNGTLASFTALIPEIAPVYIPVVVK
jgi:hypothetical protein